MCAPFSENIPPTQIPALTRDQCRAVDRLAIHEYGIPGIVLMENAGRGTAKFVDKAGASGKIVVCCGRGNNAGDGFVVARHLAILGHCPEILLACSPAQLAGDALVNYRIAERAELPIHRVHGDAVEESSRRVLEGAAWVIDALLGTGARGEPRPPFDVIIQQINAVPARRLAVDVPSGLDCDTGEPASHTVQADFTCTFVAIKRGFQRPQAKQYTGHIEVVSIGIPPVLLKRVVAGDISG